MRVVLHAVLHLLFVDFVVFIPAVEPNQVLYFEIRSRNVHDLHILFVDNHQRVAFTLVLNAVLQFKLRTYAFQNLPVLTLHAVHVACDYLGVTYLFNFFFQHLQFH